MGVFGVALAFSSSFYGFHSISSDFLRFSSIFGAQKSPGSVGEFRGVSGNLGTAGGRLGAPFSAFFRKRALYVGHRGPPLCTFFIEEYGLQKPLRVLPLQKSYMVYGANGAKEAPNLAYR